MHKSNILLRLNLVNLHEINFFERRFFRHKFKARVIDKSLHKSKMHLTSLNFGTKYVLRVDTQITFE